MMGDAQWFRIASGEHAGRWHMAGWMGHAILTLPTLDGEPPQWLSLGICPRCHATIITEQGTGNVYGDQTWAHESWHAATDYPRPGDLQGRISDCLAVPGLPLDHTWRTIRSLVLMAGAASAGEASRTLRHMERLGLAQRTRIKGVWHWELTPRGEAWR